MNLTDNEIKKAMECCGNGSCRECPRLLTPVSLRSCQEELMREALDLNNRKQAEIERLNGLLAEWKTEAYKLSDSIDNINVELTEDMIKALKNQKVINISNTHTENIYFVSSEWISVKERTPEKFTHVLCFYPNKDYGSKMVIDYAETNDGHFAEQYKFGEPSHWMPLPEPPKLRLE